MARSVVVDESLALGRDLELELEVRPVTDSGLLLHAGVRKSQQLSVYLNQGEVSTPGLHGICTAGSFPLPVQSLVAVRVNMLD